MKYFDWTATTHISTDALDEYIKVSRDFYANPSSLHYAGRKASAELYNVREKFAKLLKCNSDEIFFTSGGTESNNIIIQNMFNYSPGSEIIITSVEHSSISEFKKTLLAHSYICKEISCTNGIIDLNSLKAALSEKTKLVCMMRVNNITGALFNLNDAIKIIREFEKEHQRKIHVHSDGVQALGKIHFYPKEENLDSASFSAHKLYGPKGVGILYNSDKNITPLNRAGGQEMGLRGGTENFSGICSALVAVNNSINKLEENFKYVKKLNDNLRNFLSENNIPILSPSAERSSPYILNISLSPLPSEVALRMLSDKGFCVSSGSACNFNSRGKTEQTLKNMGIQDKLIKGSIRISLGIYNTEQDLNELCVVLRDIYGR